MFIENSPPDVQVNRNELDRSARVGPDVLPLLARGRHDRPERGTCLMEYVSVLAGKRFSDHPRCTPSSLAELARLINDAISDTSRPRLALLAPGMIDIPRHPRVSAVVLAEIARTGLTTNPDDQQLQRIAHTAARRLSVTGGCRKLAVGPRLRAAPADNRLLTCRTITTVFVDVQARLGALEMADRDQRLATLLKRAVDGCRELSGLAPYRLIPTTFRHDKVEVRPTESPIAICTWFPPPADVRRS